MGGRATRPIFQQQQGESVNYYHIQTPPPPPMPMPVPGIFNTIEKFTKK